ncbi:DUF3592 domain-containing protein [Erythrobacter sp. F6033]|uniref:DUF3592 domain-containing protein n=1 Tax=Erythrobacter sp. F6033 TaxID=2926401 RepID=UPI001FF65C8B|nr:DUF3592 domain-containing protein [Erythrobacter sp. F6033]MCK0127105.1 DUF3592 domain-containing protein [Erythrobacter sp. F6033]
MKTISITGMFFAGIGAIFAAIGGWMLWGELALSDVSFSAQGTIIELADYRDSEGTTMYRPVAEFYDTSGRRYEFSSKTSSSSPGFSVGEQVDIIYDPLRPQDARIDTFGQRFLLPTIFTAIGSLFVLIGGGMVVYPMLRARAIRGLVQAGLQVRGTITDVSQDRRFAVNDRHPWRIIAEAEHPRTGIMTEFKSDALWERPIGAKKGDQVPVYLSAKNSKKSYVDVDNVTVSASQDEDRPWRFGETRRSFGKAARRDET